MYFVHIIHSILYFLMQTLTGDPGIPPRPASPSTPPSTQPGSPYARGTNKCKYSDTQVSFSLVMLTPVFIKLACVASLKYFIVNSLQYLKRTPSELWYSKEYSMLNGTFFFCFGQCQKGLEPLMFFNAIQSYITVPLCLTVHQFHSLIRQQKVQENSNTEKKKYFKQGKSKTLVKFLLLFVSVLQMFPRVLCAETVVAGSDNIPSNRAPNSSKYLMSSNSHSFKN